MILRNASLWLKHSQREQKIHLLNIIETLEKIYYMIAKRGQGNYKTSSQHFYFNLPYFPIFNAITTDIANIFNDENIMAALSKNITPG